MSRPNPHLCHMYRRLGPVAGYFDYLAEMNGLTDHPQLYSQAHQPVVKPGC